MGNIGMENSWMYFCIMNNVMIVVMGSRKMCMEVIVDVFCLSNSNRVR